MTFLLSEDKALRERLQGITVNDQRAEGDAAPRQVGVWFGQPDQELRGQNYPYITIDLIDVVRDTEREMRGIVAPEYLAPENLDTATKGWAIHMPIPVYLDYQITTYSRQPRHDREVLSQLLYLKLPIRFGSLAIDDNTVRRLDVLNVSKRDVTEQAKRLFVNAISVRVSSEISLDTYSELYKVLQVNIDNPPADSGFEGVGPLTITG